MTTDTLTLADFLLARIAEDEAWANAAVETPGATHWHWVDPESDAPLSPDPFTQEDANDYGGASLRTVEEIKPVSWDAGRPLPDFIIWQTDEVSPGAAGHIARHDPARVLAECEAKRRIVELHGGGVHRCITGRVTWASDCLEARILAAVYADHPDYRDEWRV